jgi:hypothetical protein
MNKIILSVTTNGSGDGTTTSRALGEPGFLYAVHYTRGTLSNSTTDLTLSTVNSSGAATLLTLTDVTASGWYYPRVDVCGATGTALSFNDQLPVLDGALRAVVAQGGATATGTVEFYYFQ